MVFVISVISCFGFEGLIWVLIASVPGLCLLFTYIITVTALSLLKSTQNRHLLLGYSTITTGECQCDVLSSLIPCLFISSNCLSSSALIFGVCLYGGVLTGLG